MDILMRRSAKTRLIEELPIAYQHDILQLLYAREGEQFAVTRPAVTVKFLLGQTF